MSEIKVEGLGQTQYSSIDVGFRSNSHKSKMLNPGESKKPGKVIKGKIITRKKSLGKRIAETFLGENLSNVVSYVLHDVLVPAAKTTFSDMVSGGVERLLFGGSVNPRGRRDRGRPFVDYTGASSLRRDNPTRNPRNRSTHNMNDIILESRADAVDVFNLLIDNIEEFGVVGVDYFYSLVGVEASFTDQKYGWENLSRASVQPARGGGYIIDLPRPILIG